MAQFDPSEKGVEDVLKHLEKSDKTERDRVLAAEVGGKKRKTVLEPYGIDPDARYDGSGRQLYPWEVDADKMADADRHPEETDEERKAREAQNEYDASVASTPQLGSTGGTGSTTAAGAATGGTATTAAGAGSPAAGTSTGATGGTAAGA